MGRAYRGETFNSSKETWTSYQDRGRSDEGRRGGEGGVVEAVSLLQLMEQEEKEDKEILGALWRIDDCS